MEKKVKNLNLEDQLAVFFLLVSNNSKTTSTPSPVSDKSLLAKNLKRNLFILHVALSHPELSQGS